MKLVNGLVLTSVLSLGLPAYAAGLPSEDKEPAGKGKIVTGTIEGEVKKVQPDAVIV